MDLIIKNGTIVTASESYKADIAVKDGRIEMISENIQSAGERVVDAAGKLVLPGAI
ncbi:MAG TPA: dihydropyrimidinase, partial [Bacillota bacterium]|nr:dihydropyrimidinase [Bacillota bacterium]